MVSAIINNRKENSNSNDDDISNDNNDDNCFRQTYLNDLPLVESNKKDDENENEDEDDHDEDNNGNNNSKKTVTVVDEDPSSFSNNNIRNNNTEVKSSVHLCSCPPFTGMYKDLKARLPLYSNDWKLPQSKKSLFTILNATIVS